MAFAFASGCRGCADEAPATPAIDPGPVLWAFDGCREVRAGPICEADDPIRVWARATDGVLVPLALDGVRVVEREEVDGGVRWTLERAAPRGSVKVRELVGAARREVVLEVVEAVEYECPLDVSRLNAEDAEIAAFDDALDAVDAAKRADCWRAAGYAVRTRPEHSVRARKWLARAELGFEAEGRITSRVKAAAGRAFSLLADDRADESKRVIEAIATSSTIAVSVRLSALNTYGYAAYDLGDLGTAQDALQTAATWAERLGDRGQWFWAARLLITVHEQLGAYDEATDLATRITTHAAELESACGRKAALASVHWWTLLRRAPDYAPLDAPIADTVQGIDLDALRARMARDLESCPVLRTEVATNLALEALLAGDLDASALHLERAERWLESGARRNHPWVADTRAAWEIASGRPEAALQRIDRIERTTATTPALAWTLATRRAEAHRLNADPERAAAAWRHAAALLARWPGAVELDRQLNGMATSLHRAAQQHVGFLAERGHVAEAIEVARWSRARALLASRSVDRLDAIPPEARARWELFVAQYRRLRAALEALPAPTSDAQARSNTEVAARLGRQAEEKLKAARGILWTVAQDRELDAPKDGALFVVVHPGRNDWLLLASDGREAIATKIARLGADRAALVEGTTRALDEIDAAIERARVVRWMAVGDADGFDLHTASWRGGPLFTAKPVVFGLDVGDSARDAPRVTRALVVADPEADDAVRALPHAREEARRVRAALEARGVAVTSATGSEATRVFVLDALTNVDLFHYAGHAAPAASRFGAGLRLNGGRVLATRDVLALSRAPRAVVLSACESAVEGAEGAGLDLGVAQAFVLAGAHFVVATTRPVADATTARIGRALHTDEPLDAVRAASVLGALARDAPGDWAAFRVFVP